MQDQIRKALNDLLFLSQTLSGSERERILETIELFGDLCEQGDYFMTLYQKLYSESNVPPMEG
jgi:diaminopimelate decarboxylase